MGRPRKPADEKGERVYVSIPGKMMKLLRHFTAAHGRDDHLTEEIRALLALALADAMRDALDDAAFVEEIAAGREDFDLDAFREQVEDDYRRERALAFGRPTATNHLASMLAAR
jgi:hypothetical protein